MEKLKLSSIAGRFVNGVATLKNRWFLEILKWHYHGVQQFYS